MKCLHVLHDNIHKSFNLFVDKSLIIRNIELGSMDIVCSCRPRIMTRTVSYVYGKIDGPRDLWITSKPRQTRRTAINVRIDYLVKWGVVIPKKKKRKNSVRRS